MSDQSIPQITDEQARAIAEIAKASGEAVKALRAAGGAVWEILGVPLEDLVGLLGGNWIKVRCAENLVRTFAKASERLKRDGITAAPASLSLALPILEAAAEESREELQELWAALLAAAADSSREKSFRNSFIEVVKKMDPLDASVLRAAKRRNVPISGGGRDALAEELRLTSDQVDVSLMNLQKLELMTRLATGAIGVTPFGREFLRVLKA
jgi:hypothetical protein